jgi:hypothetical protein
MGGAKRTLLGMPQMKGAPPQSFEIPLPPNEPPRAAAPHPPASPPMPSAPPLPSEKQTMLGVARPGIAPLNPGVSKPPSIPAPPMAPSYAPPARPSEPTTEDLAVLPGHGRKRGAPWLAISLLAAALLLAGGALALFWLLRSGPALEARVALDAQGHEELVLTCATCEPGSVARLASTTASFAGGKARLRLQQALAVGKNELEVEVQPPSGRTRRARIEVPVEFRVRGDFTPLVEPSPKLAVRIEAVPGTAVVVDGQAVALGPDGKGKHAVDVSKELTGPAAKVERLERKLLYSITAPGSAPNVGEVVLQLGITPLAVDAPGSRVVTESPNFTLAGRTLKGGSISVEGRPLTVDAQGRFVQLMNVSAVGTTTITVRASAPDHAPRLFPLEVRRVDNLRDEARAFAKRAADAYSAVTTKPAPKRGLAVALAGRVTDVRSEGHTSVMLLEVTRGCEKKPCLARLVYGAKAPVSQGDRLTAYGHLSGAVDGPRPGDEIPEIRVDFLLTDES